MNRGNHNHIARNVEEGKWTNQFRASVKSNFELTAVADPRLPLQNPGTFGYLYENKQPPFDRLSMPPLMKTHTIG
jgi:hypothetical protein